jgi:hypothetical protein
VLGKGAWPVSGRFPRLALLGGLWTRVQSAT